MIVWTLLRNSLPLQLIAVALMGWAALGANNLYQQHVGASQVTTIVKEKSDANTEVANAAGADVAAGKPGKPDPNRLRSSESRPGK